MEIRILTRICEVLLILIALCLFLTCVNPRSKTIPDNYDTKGSGIYIDSCSQNTIHNLFIVGKIWGFLKYYHPSVRKGNYNWDYELFNIINSILNVQTKEERNHILYKWIEQLGNVKGEKQILVVNNDTKLLPDLSWIDNANELGKVAILLQKIKRSKRDDNCFYVTTESGKVSPTFMNENLYRGLLEPDDGYNILALFRYWNIIEYYYPYKYLIDKKWDEVLIEYIPRFLNINTWTKYKLVLQRLITEINDSHARLVGREDINYKSYLLPVHIRFIEGKATVVHKIPNSLRTRLPLQLGDVIIKVNDESVDSIVNRLLPYQPGSNHITRKRDISKQLLYTNEKFIYLEYNRNGKIIHDTIRSFFIKEAYKYLRKISKPSYKIVDKNVGYIYTGNLKCDSIPIIMNKLHNTQAIIIDLRCYPHEPILQPLLLYLYSMPMSFSSMSNFSIEFPGLFKIDKSQCFYVGNNNPNCYKGKIIVLVNEDTQSMAEFLTMALQAIPNAKVVGSNTAGTNGNISYIPLPGNLTTTISGVGIYYPNGSETQRIGIIPDIIINPTIRGIYENRDEILEAALLLIQ